MAAAAKAQIINYEEMDAGEAVTEMTGGRGPDARVQKGEIDPTFVITHRMKLDEAPDAYEIFKHKKDNCIKVVLKP
jgi:threonine dehydrogenase-like Zn-dependent dehydrogenase